MSASEECPGGLIHIDVRAVSQPVCKLIAVAAKCMGTLYQPTRVRREAKAEADAQIALAAADIKTRETAQRAVSRMARQELRRQQNIESIVQKAITEMPPTASQEQPGNVGTQHLLFRRNLIGIVPPNVPMSGITRNLRPSLRHL